MISKFLEKRVEIEPEENQQGGEDPLELEYYLLECDFDGSSEKDFQKGYGVEIIQKHQGILEKKRFENVFCTREKTQNLVKLLANNTVTPSSLVYVLDDLLGT